MDQALTTIDWIVIAGYFGLILGIVWWTLLKKQDDTEDYFLAGRNAGWFVIGASIFASNIGSEHLVGLAGAGANSGVVMGHWELHSWIILLLGWVFVPFYLRSNVFTMPEFLEKRFNESARWFLSVVMLVGYVLTKIAVTLYAGGIVIEALTDLNFWWGAIILVVLTGAYTIAGGLRAVVYTDALQCVVLILGSLAVTGFGLAEIGGWNNLYEIAGSEHFDMWKPADHPNFPWPGMLFGAPIVGIWYWCTDQYIVQRTLAARGEQQARRGTIFAGYLKILPFFIFIIPGIIAYALAQSGQIGDFPSDQAFPLMVKHMLPTGLRGLLAAGLLSALMSSLSSVFNSCSTLFTVDIYERLVPDASEQHYLYVGRIATVVATVLGLLWIPIIRGMPKALYHYLQSVQSMIAPPIAAVFLLGVFWSRINATAAVRTLVWGFVAGMLRLVAEVNLDGLAAMTELYPHGTIGVLYGALHWFASINFLYFAILLFVLSVCALVVISLCTEKPSPEKLDGLTYATTTAEDQQTSRASWNWVDVVNSVVIIVILIVIFGYFTG
jgi:SSS family solute:Na+ symporter